jgi:hypothetical protein
MESLTIINGSAPAAGEEPHRSSTPAPELADMLSPRFGEQVVEAYRGGRLLNATGPRAWALFWVLSSVLASAVALSTFGRVEVVAVGAGRVAIGSALEVISLVSEADRAALRPGLPARVELEHTLEPLVLPARVVRISDGRARASEIAELFGDAAAPAGSFYRVDLEVADGEELARARAIIFPGMLVTTRYTLRTERPITFVLQPLRRWLD